MSTYPNSAYHIYISESLPPLIVEIFFDWVYQTGEPHGKPVSNYENARFVRLQEVREVGEVEAANEAPRL